MHKKTALGLPVAACTDSTGSPTGNRSTREEVLPFRFRLGTRTWNKSRSYSHLEPAGIFSSPLTSIASSILLFAPNRHDSLPSMYQMCNAAYATTLFTPSEFEVRVLEYPQYFCKILRLCQGLWLPRHFLRHRLCTGSRRLQAPCV